MKRTFKILVHHGILGMKWGIRRWQNKDGSLTEEGKKRYLTNISLSGRSSIYWDTDDGMPRKKKAKEREFMRKMNSVLTDAEKASYEQFCKDFNYITKSTDKETIDVVAKTSDSGGGDPHYLEKRTFDEYKQRYSDCGSEEQLKKAFEYVEKINKADDDQARFMLGYMNNFVEYLGFKDPKEKQEVTTYLKSAYAIFEPDEYE